MTREDIVNEARTWIGTPFQHQGRVKGVGADCVGIIIGVARDLGLSEFDTRDYSKYPNVPMMGSLLREHLEEIDYKDVQPGDVLWIKVKGSPQHLAMKTDKGILHAHMGLGKCVEVNLDKATERLVMSAFRIKGCN